MQINKETDYAIRCVLYLSGSNGRVVMANEIARAKRIPRAFLAKILQKLTKRGLVKSFKGIKGGFQLSKRPKEISLLDVIEAIEGPVAMNRCAIDKRMCSLSNTCSIHPVWVKLRKEVEKKLMVYNFERLLKEGS
ncbi:MAG: Rrf2 family transcriptional regulator [Thermodesulfovibrionia bacterium]